MADARESDADRELRLDLIRTLIEAIARYLHADSGIWTLEFRLEHGHLSRWYRHHGPEGAKALATFGEGAE